MTPKIGMEVSPWYDGKASRGCPGIIRKLRAQSALVEFTPYCSEQPVSLWFRRRRFYNGKALYQAHLKSDDSVMASLFGLRGDYYNFWIGENSGRLDVEEE